MSAGALALEDVRDAVALMLALDQPAGGPASSGPPANQVAHQRGGELDVAGALEQLSVSRA